MNGQDKEMELTVRVDGVVRCLVRECRVGEERQMVGSRGGRRRRRRRGGELLVSVVTEYCCIGYGLKNNNTEYT